MPFFMVLCYEGGESDKKKVRKIEAKDEREAAETVCGGALLERGKLGQLRAVVSPLARPSDKTPFYVREA